MKGSDVVFPFNPGNTGKWLCALKHLAVLAVTGSQAGQFLQGQMTCNVNDIDEKRAALGAFCTAQGKVISTFLLIKTAAGYWLVLPEVLLAAVKNHLQKYILRADVQLLDCTESLCLLGSSGLENESLPLFSCRQFPHVNVAFSHRTLWFVQPEQAIGFWAEKIRNQAFIPVGSNCWRYLDVVDGTPWLTTETSGQFIPQMLSLDKLGAVSFNKGCYTGQEVVARTHYLGKAKRSLMAFAIDPPVEPAPHSPITDADRQIVARVLNAAQHNGLARLSCVLPEDTDSLSLHLPDFPNHRLTLIN